MNKYQKVFPQCPYRGKGNKKCSHKLNKGDCIYISKPEKCELYNESVEQRKAFLHPLESVREPSHIKGENN